MQNHQQNIITQAIACLLIVVLTLSPLASHAHASEEPQPCKNCTTSDESACGCCQTQADCHHQSDNDSDQPHHKCFCSCFINLLSILPKLDFQNTLTQQPFYLLEFQINIIPVIQNIYRPPKN